MEEIMTKYRLSGKRTLNYCVSEKREPLLEGKNSVTREKL